MLLFGGTAGFFAMLPPSTNFGVLVGALSMLVPSIGAVVVMMLAGHVRLRALDQFLPFLLAQPKLADGGLSYILVGSLAFALSAIAAVEQVVDCVLCLCLPCQVQVCCARLAYAIMHC